MKNAKIPTRGSEFAAGFDLYTIDGPTILKPLERKLFQTGIAVAIHPFHYGRIAPRSGLALKHGIDVLGGVIDEDYRNSIGVILINFSSDDYTVNKHDKIAQFIIEPYVSPTWIESELPESFRDLKGYGHSGY